MRAVCSLPLCFLPIMPLLSAQASAFPINYWGGDHQTATVLTAFAAPLQVQIPGACIDKPCAQVDITFTVASSQLGTLCTPACLGATSVTVQNPPDSDVATVWLMAGPRAGSYLVSAASAGNVLYFDETNVPGPPHSVAATGGTPQTATVGSLYERPLQGIVTDIGGNPLVGVVVTFSAPRAGASVSFSGSLSAQAITDSSGVATSPIPKANRFAGSLSVRGTAEGAAEIATFSLTNVRPTAAIVVDAAPAGLSVVVDGASYTAPAAFTWQVGSQHTIATTSPQAGAAGSQYVFAGWSDGGAMSHTITTPSSSTSYTASFGTQYLLTTSASPSGGGSVGPASGFYNAGQVVVLSATANAGFAFSGWAGTGVGSYTGANPAAAVTMNGPITETASFSPAPAVRLPVHRHLSPRHRVSAGVP
jgi:hypothetical protein